MEIAIALKSVRYDGKDDKDGKPTADLGAAKAVLKYDVAKHAFATLLCNCGEDKSAENIEKLAEESFRIAEAFVGTVKRNLFE